VKAIKKAQKIFFYDWNAILDEGARFENFIAVHLLKWIYFEQDANGRNLELRFYRDKYNREVDFVVLENSRPLLFIETKLSDAETSKGLQYLKSKYPRVRALQVHLKGHKDFVNGDGIEHFHCLKFLKDLA
jgi:predicted AAA+ superfamily ATPase